MDVKKYLSENLKAILIGVCIGMAFNQTLATVDDVIIKFYLINH